ncbi:hypothetical protein F4808DRAFT_460671 [Astrocystis sublimbata]|nr:hypothetical protein F4808DRAFT_460671 [Astrocystis sublimbata]
MVTSTSSAEYGRRLIPHIIDDKAAADPQREILLVPRSSDPQDGWATITAGEYANAINYCAKEIVDAYGDAAKGQFPTIAYIGPQDARYLILTIAAIKAGYQALFISPRNSEKAQLNLFEKTDCRILWYDESFSQAVKSWLLERKMQTIQVQKLQRWFPEEQVPHIPYEKTFEQAEMEPFCVLHTSGSTGLPKPIVARTGMMSISDANQRLPEWQGSRFWLNEVAERVQRVFLPMPLFHAASHYTFFYISVYRNLTTVLTIHEKPLSADLALACIENVDFQAILLPPSVLEDITHSEESISKLKKLKLIVFGGGHLAREAGQKLVQNNVPIFNSINSTEFGSFPLYFHQDPEAWSYFKFNSEQFGADWRPAHDGCYELVTTRKENEQPGMKGYFYTFPDLNEFNTKDLYKPHPTLPDFWLYQGRADNIIVFSNGEKLNPVTIEEIVQDHTDVSGALVTGSNKFQAGLLIEPSNEVAAEDEQKFIDNIWPLVEKANKATVAHGQISRELIALAAPGKPFLRSGKGTIQRASTIHLYAEEIDEMYNRAETGSRLVITEADMSSEDTLAALIARIFQPLGLAINIDSDADFFIAGIDSLQIMNASRSLRASLEFPPAVLNAQTFYRNPTPRRLAQFILHTISNGGTEVSNGVEDQDIRVAKQLYEKHARNPIPGRAGRPEPPSHSQTILLTGSTGALGSYLLDQLVRNPAIEKVVCLNRATDGGAKQQEKQMKDRGLVQDLEHANKVEFLHADLSNGKLGLGEAVYNSLLQKVHRIVHNAWPVNFNISTESFEPHLQGVRHLADFAATANHRVAVVFLSSIGTVNHWDPNRGPVPEERMEDWSLPSNSYGRSKMAASLILDDAAAAGDFPAASIRVGQIAGPESEAGSWNRHEWLPSIIASSLYLGVMPHELGSNNRVDWVPVERVARVVLDVVEAKESTGYFHAVHPSATTWGQLAPTAQKYYGDRIKEVVSWQEWVDRLENSATAENDIEGNPGLKLIETYRGMAAGTAPVILDLQRTIRRSRALAEAPMVSPKLLEQWLRQWNF